MFDRVLILSPHPDDEVLSCGGLISYCKRNNKLVHVLYFSYVLLGVEECMQVTGKVTNKQIRQKEIENVSKLGNFSYDVSIPGVFDHRLKTELINDIESQIKKISPDLVCIPSLLSCNQDHRIIAEAALTALRPLSQKSKFFVKNILEYEEPYGWYLDASFNPNFYLSLEKQDVDCKLELIKLHETQMRDHPSTRSLQNIESVLKIRGAETGQEYAEAYKVHRILA